MGGNRKKKTIWKRVPYASNFINLSGRGPAVRPGELQGMERNVSKGYPVNQNERPSSSSTNDGQEYSNQYPRGYVLSQAFNAINLSGRGSATRRGQRRGMHRNVSNGYPGNSNELPSSSSTAGGQEYINQYIRYYDLAQGFLHPAPFPNLNQPVSQGVYPNSLIHSDFNNPYYTAQPSMAYSPPQNGYPLIAQGQDAQPYSNQGPGAEYAPPSGVSYGPPQNGYPFIAQGQDAQRDSFQGAGAEYASGVTYGPPQNGYPFIAQGQDAQPNSNQGPGSEHINLSGIAYGLPQGGYPFIAQGRDTQPNINQELGYGMMYATQDKYYPNNEPGYSSLPRINEPGYTPLPGTNEPGYSSLPRTNEPGYSSLPNTNEPGYSSLPGTNEPGHTPLPTTENAMGFSTAPYYPPTGEQNYQMYGDYPQSSNVPDFPPQETVSYLTPLTSLAYDWRNCIDRRCEEELEDYIKSEKFNYAEHIANGEGETSQLDSNEEDMITETNQSSPEDQQCAQEVSEEQPIVYNNKVESHGNFLNYNVGIIRNQGLTESYNFNARNTVGKTVPFDQKQNSSYYFPHKISEVPKDETVNNPEQLKDSAEGGAKIKDDVFISKGTKSGTVIADNALVRKPIKEAINTKNLISIQSMSGSFEASKKKSSDDESIKGLKENASENQFQPVMKMENLTDINKSDVLKAVADCSFKQKTTESAKKNKITLNHDTDGMIANSFNKYSLSCSVEDKNNEKNPLIPHSPCTDLNCKAIDMNEDSSKSVYLACIKEEETAKLNSALSRPRSPYPDFLETDPKVFSSTANYLSQAPENPISGTIGTSKSDKANPATEKPLTSTLRLIPYHYPDSSVPEILSPATKGSSPVHEIPLNSTNGTSKSDKTNPVEEKSLNPTLRLIPYILPDSSASETSDNNEPELELKQVTIIPEDLKPAPMIPIPEKNGKSQKRMSDILSSIPNPFKRRSKSYNPQSNFEQPKIEPDKDTKTATALPSQKPAKQSIYKLAYNNESTTDSSSTHSRSLSPVDREKLIPRDTFHDEIVVYEAASDSEPGSEDLELLPHRYDCDTFQNKENNIYINKLSLAVELIRTQEDLPYDDQFKRIVEDDSDPNREESAKENLGFEVESPGLNDGKVASNSPRNVVVTSPPIRSDSLATTGVTSTTVDIFTDSCEEAGRAELSKPSSSQNVTEETRAINRRIRGHMRHYLSSRVFGNNCACCIIM